MSGDGRADYLFVNSATGKLRLYQTDEQNSASGPSWWKFTDTGGARIDSGKPASRIRTANMTGDGVADITLLNDDGTFRVAGSAAITGSTVHDPDETQFVDVNGDGKADCVWTRKINGVSEV